MKFQSKKQQERYEKGLCINCENVREGKRHCRQCKEKIRIYKQKLIDQKLCFDCLKPISVKRRCSECLDRASKYNLNYYRRRIKNSKCVKCGQHTISGIECETCKKNRNENCKLHKRQQIESGQCIICDQPLYSARYCLKHQKRQKEYNLRHYKSEKGQATRNVYTKSEKYQQYRNSEQAHRVNRNAYHRRKFINRPDVMTRIVAFVPSDLPPELREDISQEILLRLCDQKLYVDEIPGAIKQITTEQRKFLPSKYNVQLDGLEDWQIDRLEGKQLKKVG